MADNPKKNNSALVEEGTENYGLPSNWAEVEAAPVNPNVPKMPNSPTATGVDPYGSGPLPPNFGLQPALVKTGNPANAGPISLMPVEGGPQPNARAISVAKTVVEQSGTSIDLQTNGSENPNQTKLNLIAGSGISINSTLGGTTISSTSSFDPIDPSTVYLRDDFVAGTATGGQIGELRWAQPSTGAGTTSQNMGQTPHLGVIDVQNGTQQGSDSNGYTSFTIPFQAGTSNPYNSTWDLLTNPGWKMTWIWRWQTIPTASPSGPAFAMTNKSFYVGLCMAQTTSLLRRPSIFIGARFDTDTTAPSIGDTTIKLEAVFNTLAGSVTNVQGTVVDTGVTPTQGTWYRLDIECTAAGVFTMSLNGASSTQFTMSPIAINYTSAASVSAGNGLVSFQIGGTSAPWGSGTEIVVSGLTGAPAVLNGTYILDQAGDSGPLRAASTQTVGPTPMNFTVTGYPSLLPFLNWGNDTAGSPTNDVSMQLDFFGFNWNTELASSPLPLADTNSRLVQGS